MSYYDFGPYSLAVTTQSPDAQMWFDRGLNWTYGYNHDEAQQCFRQAIEADPACAMAHWGLAYAAGPNYNLPWQKMDPKGRVKNLATAYDATQAALAEVDRVSPVERALIEAISARYPQRDPLEDHSAWNDNFANAMRAALAAHPDDLDIRTICVEALLNRTPWKMWNLSEGVPADGADTLECEAIAEQALDHDPRAMRHPGLLHVYVHLMEMSPYPERALKAGDALRQLVPDAGLSLIHI